MVRVTSAKPRALRWGVPLKMTSSIFEQRRVRTLCSPSTQRMASLMLLLPLPLGPTTEVMPRSNWSVVLSGKVLNPCSSKDFKIIAPCFPFSFLVSWGPTPKRPGAREASGAKRTA